MCPPEEYEAIRDNLKHQGYDEKRAKGLAARIFNKRHGKGHGLRPDKKKKATAAKPTRHSHSFQSPDDPS